MKSNNFRYLLYNVRSKEDSLLCFVKFVALVSMLKKETDIKKLDLEVSIVSSNNESEFPAKTKIPRPGGRSFLLCKWT